MRFAFPAIVLSLLVAAGCQDKKQAVDSGAMDLNGSSQGAVLASATPSPAYQPIQTVAPDASAAPMPSSGAGMAGSGGSYTIRPGDTLWRIASTHYGDGHKWRQIADANPGIEPSKLRVGQTINLP